MKKYWHITSVKSFPIVLREGLQLNNQGLLFLFDTQEYAARIASDQCGFDQYALLRVSNIDESRLKPDKVAELTAHAQWMYDRPIPAKDIKLKGVYIIPCPSRATQP